jgi:hypothetical protein
MKRWKKSHPRFPMKFPPAAAIAGIFCPRIATP